MKTFAASAIAFYKNLHPDFPLPQDFHFIMAYEDPAVQRITNEFYKEFYNDTVSRIFVIGINPGRFGSGVTGISFTDPIRLESQCGILNPFNKKPELSSNFIYEVINAYGSVESFYKKFFLTAVCPIGFIKNGKNINYYDDKLLLESSRNFIIAALKKQLEFGANRNIAICLGDGKNFNYLNKLNEEFRFFKEIVPLAHPRFIMQYKRKKLGEYIQQYVSVFNNAYKKQENF